MLTVLNPLVNVLLLAVTFFWVGCGASSSDTPAPAFARETSKNLGPDPRRETPVNDKVTDDVKADADKSVANGKCPKYPMVFHHGFMGGAAIGGFKDVEAHFRQRHCKVYVTEVAAVQTSAYRGAQLKERIETILAASGAEKVHIIAHSQGGLDARYAISVLGLGDRVASLSMLGTPNHGTRLADMALSSSGPVAKKALSALLNMMGKTVNSNTPDPDTLAAVESLSVAYVDGPFNHDVKDVDGVVYQSWAGVSGGTSGDQTKTLLLLSQGLLSLSDGPNDGVVPEISAKWGNFRDTVAADHMDLIGYQMFDVGSPFKHLDFLDTLASELVTKGL